MTQDNVWKHHPLEVMYRANELGRLVEHLLAEDREGVWYEGTTIAVPVLLSLAAEIGLKAWHHREGNDPPPKTHDLLELFDSLGKNTRRRLEDKMPEIPSDMPGYPAYPGIRDALCQNRNIFTQWRYAHEHDGLIAQTSFLQTALKVIVDEFMDEVPPENRLKGRSIKPWPV